MRPVWAAAPPGRTEYPQDPPPDPPGAGMSSPDPRLTVGAGRDQVRRRSRHSRIRDEEGPRWAADDRGQDHRGHREPAVAAAGGGAPDRVIPHIPGVVADLRRAMRTRAFTVKIGGVELSVEEAAEQAPPEVTDLQTHMAIQLAERGRPARPAPDPPGSPGAAARPTPRPPRPPTRAAPPSCGSTTTPRPTPWSWPSCATTASSPDRPLDGRGHGRPLPAPGRRRHRHRHGPHRGRRVPLRRPRPPPPAPRGRAVPARARLPSTRRVELDRQDALDAGATTVTSSPTELFAALRRVLSTPAPHPEPGPTPAAAASARRPSRPG